MATPTAQGVPIPEIDCVHEPARAAALLSPVRIDILDRARTPRSATEIAADLGLPRQRVNYHVRELHRARFLRRAGRRKKRNLYEQRYVTAARAWVLSQEILGPVAADVGAIEDTLSAAHLLALTARAQAEVARASRGAAASGKRLATFSISADVRFESAKQRAAFATALGRAVERVVAEHTSPATRDDGSPAPGRPFRLLVGCHPVPKPQEV